MARTPGSRTTPAKSGIKATTSSKSVIPTKRTSTTKAAKGLSAGTEASKKAAPVNKENELKRQEFLDLVAERSGIKRGEVRTVVDAALSVIGEALEAQRYVSLEPLGKIKITQAKTQSGSSQFVARIRRRGAESQKAKNSSSEKTKEDLAES